MEAQTGTSINIGVIATATNNNRSIVLCVIQRI
jgi:hypothetical protein